MYTETADRFSPQVERALDKATLKMNLREQLCSCLVITEEGKRNTVNRYAHDYAELCYTLLRVEKMQKLIAYTVIQ